MELQNEYNVIKKEITEESVIFVSIIKWFILAALSGAIIGLATAIFLKLLNGGINYTGKFPFYFFLMPLSFFLCEAVIKYLAPDAEGHGTEKVIKAVHKDSGKINPMVVPVKLITTIITIATGGSAGKEGPCAQIGAGLSSILAGLLRLNDYDRKKLVICGISAGFASVFGTPVSGAIFGIEVLAAGSMLYDVLLPSFIAGLTSYQVSSYMGVQYFHHNINLMHKFEGLFFIKIVLAGIFFGLCAFIFIEILHICKHISNNIKTKFPVKGITGGILLIILTFIFSKDYLGLGLDTIEKCLSGQEVVWYAFIAKILFTSITLNFGGSGGIVTPIFFIGSASGNLFAQLMGLNVANFSAIGFVALLAGAANTPIAASIMAMEIFGSTIANYAAIVCVISFVMTGHRSVYPYQILAIQKSHSLKIDLGMEIRKTDVILQPEVNSYLIRLIRIIKIRIKKAKRRVTAIVAKK